jgi:hypothetical protein
MLCGVAEEAHTCNHALPHVLSCARGTTNLKLQVAPVGQERLLRVCLPQCLDADVCFTTSSKHILGLLEKQTPAIKLCYHAYNGHVSS